MHTDSTSPKLILNDDGSNFLYAADDVDAQDLRAYLSRLEDTQVDMVCYCVAFGGYVTYYESEVAEPVGTGFALGQDVKQLRWARNRGRLRDQVGDYIGYVFSVLSEMGIPAVASFRMNDAHMSSDSVGPVAGRFWMNHPEWRLGEPYGYYASCLDYSAPQVREYLRRLILEVLGKFPDIAGIELDAMRSPFFFRPDEGVDKAPLMTEFIAQIREDLDQVAADRGGRPYLLRVNLPRSPRLCLETGLDVAAWTAEGLVDAISPGCYNTDFQIPIEQWRGVVGDQVSLHAYLNCSPGAGRYLSLEEYRGAAANAWDEGADGIYLFNFPCLDELAFLVPTAPDRRPFPPPPFGAQCWHPDLSHARDALRELGDPDRLARASKRYLFYTLPAVYRHYVQERASIERLVPEPAELHWRCADDPKEAVSYQLDVKLVGVTLNDGFAFQLNGQPVGAERIKRLHAANGRDPRVHPERLAPYSQYTIDPDPNDLRKGANTLTVSITCGDQDLLGPIEVRELEVSVAFEEG